MGAESKSLLEEWLDAGDAGDVEAFRHDVQEVIVDGDSIAARTVVTGTLVEPFAGVPPSGEPFRLDQVVFAHVRDGKVAEMWEVADVGVLLRGGT
jgi:predicted ester cyclase